MALLAPQRIVRTGLEPTFVAAAGGGDTFARSDDAILHVKNGSVGSITVTIQSQAVPGPGEAVADEAIAIPAGEERLIGPFPAAFENADGNVEVTYSGVTSLTVAVYDAP